MDAVEHVSCEHLVDSICGLDWTELSAGQLQQAAIMYYYFSIQFRENLQIARRLYPADEKLMELDEGECDTDNLSPWPGVAEHGEKMNHDEFMRRALALSPIDAARRDELDRLGTAYLAIVRDIDLETRARSIASYEDGGLERVFSAMLTAREWGNPTLLAFQHFLVRHIHFDHDPDHGHGALARHLGVGNEVAPLWAEFRRILVEAVPRLAGRSG